MYFKTYCTLPKEAAEIRRAVFMQEQGFREEFDEVDAVASHIVLYDEESRAVAVCRYFRDAEKESYVVGRIAVIKQMRGKHFGALLLEEAERQIKGRGEKRLMLAAQVQARRFYEKQGYFAVGSVFYEECCPHIWMEKEWEDCI